MYGLTIYLLKTAILAYFLHQVWGTTNQPSPTSKGESGFFQFCEFPVQPVGVYPLNSKHQANDVTRNKATGKVVNVDYAPGIHGDQAGSLLFRGNDDSYIELDEGRLDVKHSVTILLHAYPSGGPGPIVNYKVDGYGVQLWQTSDFAHVPVGVLTARVNDRDLGYTPPLGKQVLLKDQWNYIGVTYDQTQGKAVLWHDGNAVVSKYIGKIEIATQFKVRMGALKLTDLTAYFRGRVACLQFYPEALSQDQIKKARNACKPYFPVSSIFLEVNTTNGGVELNDLVVLTATNKQNTLFNEYHFDVGDGSPVVRSHGPTIRYRYTLYGEYQLRVTVNSSCTNEVLTAGKTLMVFKPIKAVRNVTLSCQTTAFPNSAVFELIIDKGTDLVCRWNFGDGMNINATYSERGTYRLNYNYTNTGNYSVTVSCGNRKGSAFAATHILVQAPIRDLRIKKISVKALGESFKIEWRVKTGSQIDYKATIARKRLETLKSENETIGWAWVRQNVDIGEGFHDVIVQATNDITDTIEAKTQVRIVKRVAPFKPVVLHPNKYIEVNESIVIYFTDTNVANSAYPIYHVDFGDASEKVESLNLRVSHSYRNYGEFLVTVYAYNNATAFNASVVVKVEKPVILIQEFSVKSHATALTNSTKVFIFGRGTDLECIAQFGDGNHRKLRIAALQNGANTRMVHRYNSIGVYNIQLFCWNRLSQQNDTTTVIVQEPVKGSRLLLTSPQAYGKPINVSCTVDSGTNVTFEVKFGDHVFKLLLNGTSGYAMIPQQVYKTVGEHVFTVQTSNLISESKLLKGRAIVEFPVSGLTVTIDKNSNYIEVNQTIGVNATVMLGSSLKFIFDFGDNETKLGNLTHYALHKYNRPLVYRIRVTAYNQVSEMQVFLNVTVEKPVIVLRNMTLIAFPTKLQEDTSIVVHFDKGSNFKCEWYFGDGNMTTALYADDTSVTDLKYVHNLRIATSYRYNTVGVFHLAVRCQNRLSMVQVSRDVVVQEPISGLAIKEVLPKRIGEEFSAFWNVTSGTNITFHVEFLGGKILYVEKHEKFGHARLVSGIAGEHAFLIRSHNLVSAYTLSVIIVVEHVITNITVTTSHKTRDVEMNENVTYVVGVKEGINPMVVFDFGDGIVERTKSKEVVHEYEFNDAFYQGRSFVEYLLRVQVFNNVSAVNKNISVKVFKPVLTLRGIHIISSPANVSEQGIMYLQIKQGSDFNCTFRFGDQKTALRSFMYLNYLGKERNLTDKFRNLTHEIRHVFDTVSMYNVTVECTNRLSTVRDVTLVSVQEPIRSLQLSHVTPKRFNDSFDISWHVYSGTDVIYEFYFEQLKIERIEVVKNGGRVLIEPGFCKNDGIYTIRIRATNLVSQASSMSRIIIQYSASTISLRMSYQRNGKSSTGHGYLKNYFPSNEDLVFTSEVDMGTNLTYFWSVDGSAYITGNPTAMFKFQDNETHRVKVRARNLVSEVQDTVRFIVQKKVKRLSLWSNSPQAKNRTTSFRLSGENMGTETCFIIDMGDGTTYLYGTKTCNRTSGDVKFFYHTSISFKHVYTSVGSYYVTVNASNIVSFESIKLLIGALEAPCGNPIASIQNLGNTMFTAAEVFHSRPFTVNTDVQLNCERSPRMKFTWIVLSMDPSTGKLKHLRRHDIPDKDMADSGSLQLPQLSIQKRNLPYGLYKIVFIAQMVLRELSGFQTTTVGYMRIVPSPLIATLAGGKSIRRGFGKNITVDGSMSEDEDVKGGSDSGLQFTWLCRSIRTHFPTYITQALGIPMTSRRRRSQAVKPNLKGGCYGDGKFVLATSGKVFTVETSRMIEGEEYVIMAVVRKGSRVSQASQVLEVVQGDPPTITMTCVQNCKSKLNTSKRLTIKAECMDGCIGKILYGWEVFIKGRSMNELSWTKRDDILQVMSVSDKTGPVFAIPRNIFKGGETYLVRVYGRRESGVPGKTDIILLTNTPPTGGTCFAKPIVGEALVTNFKIHCGNWSDPDQPIRYEFSYKNEHEKISLLSYGTSSTVFSKLPLGDVNNNFTLEIHAKAVDYFGGQALSVFTIQSSEPKMDDEELGSMLSNMTSGEGNAMGKLMNSGDYQSALQLAGAVNSLLNAQTLKVGPNSINDNGTRAGKRKHIRTSVINAVTAIPVMSLEGLQQTADTIAGAAKIQKETSTAAQNSSAKAFKDMTTLLSKSSGEGAGYDSIVDSAEPLLGAMGQVLEAAAGSVTFTVKKKNVTNSISLKCALFDFLCLEKLEMIRLEEERRPKNNTEDEEEVNVQGQAKESQNVANGIVGMLDSVGDAILNNKLSGEKPSVLSTTTMKMAVERADPTSLSGSVIGDGPAGFQLPSGVNLFKNIKDSSKLKQVDRQMTAMNNNPFTWDTRASEVKGQVVSLSFSSGGESLDVNGLDEPIDIFIPRDTALDPSDEFCLEPNKRRGWNIHRFEIKENGTAVNVDVGLTNKNDKLEVYTRRGKLPQIEDFDWKIEVSNTTFISNCSSCTSRLSRNVSRLFLSDRVVWAGTYYVGVRIKNRSPLEASECVNYTMRIYQSKCLYWNEEKQKWRSDGCQVGNKTDILQTHCRCTHLTAFGGALDVAPNAIDFSVVLAGFSSMFDTGNVAVFFTILSLFMIYPLLLLWARRADQKDLTQLGSTPIPSTIPEAKYRYEITFSTGKRGGNGTTAQVSCNLIGTDGESGPMILKDNKRTLFQQGNVNSFIISVPGHIGNITELRVWHDNYGLAPSWYLKRVAVRDFQKEETWLILCERWLAVDEDDGKILRSLKPANSKDLTRFKVLFNSKITRDLSDAHLWFSVLYRPARSRFTRVHRVSCCLCLLCTAMVASAMFYGQGLKPGEDDQSEISIGPIKISLRSIVIGIQSCLVIVPVNIVIVAIFRGVKAKAIKFQNFDEKDSAYTRRMSTASILGDTKFLYSRRASKISIMTDMEESDSRRSSSIDVSMDLMSRTNTNASKSHSSRASKGFAVPRDELRLRSGSEMVGILDSEEAILEEKKNCSDIVEIASMDGTMYKDTAVLTVDDRTGDTEEDNKTHNTNKDILCCFSNLPKIYRVEGREEYRDTKEEREKRLIAKRKEKVDKKEEKAAERKRKQLEGFLPYWCIYVAWSLCIVTSLTSALFTLFYSMMWGTEKSNEWLVTMLLSLTMDILVSQPIKVLIVSLLFALIIKKPDHDEDTVGSAAEKDPDEDWLHEDLLDDNVINEDEKEHQLRLYQPPDPEQLQELRQSKLKEKKLKMALRQLLFYTIVLTVLMLVGFGNRDSRSYPLRRSLEQRLIEPLYRKFGKMSQVSNVNKFWDYLEQTFIPGLFEHAWYNGQQSGRDGFLADRQSRRVGVARLRQLRVENESCSVPEPMQNITPECNIDYSIIAEDNKMYDRQWRNGREKRKASFGHFLSRMKGERRIRGKLSPWDHLTASEANHSLPVIGTISTYSGGGYIAELGNNIDYAKAFVKYLKQSKWVDKYTRGIFVEATIYNSNVNLIAVMDILIEFTTAGLALPKYNFMIFSVYPSISPSYALYSTCELVFLFLLIISVYMTAKKFFYQRKVFFKRTLNWVDLVFIANGIAGIVIYVRRYLFISRASARLQEDQTSFVGFYECALTVEALVYMVGFATFLTVFKLLHSLSFTRDVQLLVGTLSNAAKDLHCYMLIMFVLLMAFASLTFPVFAPHVKEYRSVLSTLQALFSIILGSFNYNDYVLQSDFETIGRFFFVCYATSMSFVFMNVFLSIITNVYAELQDDEEFHKQEINFFKIMQDKILIATGLKKPPERRPPVIDEPDIKEIQWNLSASYILDNQITRVDDDLNCVFVHDQREDVKYFTEIAIAKGVTLGKSNDDIGVENAGLEDEENEEPNVLLQLIAKKKKQLGDIEKEGHPKEEEKSRLIKVLKCLEELLEDTRQRNKQNVKD